MLVGCPGLEGSWLLNGGTGVCSCLDKMLCAWPYPPTACRARVLTMVVANQLVAIEGNWVGWE